MTRSAARNLLFSGGVGHDFDATSRMVAEILGEVGIESVVTSDLEEGGRFLGAERFDLVTFNALAWRMLDDKYAPQRDRFGFSPSPELRRSLSSHVRTGNGLLALHTAAICFDDWPEWGEMLGGAWAWGRSNHPPLSVAHITVQTGAHDIVAGIGDFDVEDEVYGFLDLRSDVEGLMASPHGGTDHPLLWARPYDLGRVVYDALGHGEASYEHPAQRLILQRAATWLLAGRGAR